MSEVALRGGPLDGTIRETYAQLKVVVEEDYGWRYKCGEKCYAFGFYDHRGSWHEPERDRVSEQDCPRCEGTEYGWF